MSSKMVNVLEECQVSPSPNAVGEKSLPLTFFDLLWLHFHLVQSLFFYKFPHSKTQFIETPIPSLKHSLSLALRHFYPFEGNLLFPPNLREPEIHYVDGDSVSLSTFAESNSDFDYLIPPKENCSLSSSCAPIASSVGTTRHPSSTCFFYSSNNFSLLWNFLWVHHEPCYGIW